MPQLFDFPDPVNEVSARLVAGGVVVMAVATVALDQPWILIVLAYGFVARVLTGPTLSPLGQLATRFVTPRLPVAPKYVAGPPKRFAQGIGAALTFTAAILHFGFGLTGAAYVVVGAVAVAAALESVFALCIGCKVFALLMRLGVVPEEICERCNDPPLGRQRGNEADRVAPYVGAGRLVQFREPRAQPEEGWGSARPHRIEPPRRASQRLPVPGGKATS